jgi:flagellar basal-body rod protein FlgB
MAFASILSGKKEGQQMSVNGIFDTSINLLGKSLDLRAQNHNRLSANIANAETPGYTPTALSFEKELQGVLKEKGGTTPAMTNPRHIALRGDALALEMVQGTVINTSSGSAGLDGNGVELESEMGRMVENQIMYNADIQILSKKFSSLTLAIKGGN